jgi:hypothetical protein
MRTVFSTSDEDLEYRTVLSGTCSRGVLCLIFNDPAEDTHAKLFVVGWRNGDNVNAPFGFNDLGSAVKQFSHQAGIDVSKAPEVAAMQAYCNSVLLGID